MRLSIVVFASFSLRYKTVNSLLGSFYVISQRLQLVSL